MIDAHSISRSFLSLAATAALFTFVLLFLSPTQAHAANLFWVGVDGSADPSVASNWRTTNPTSCTGGNAPNAPGATDTANFVTNCGSSITWNSSAAGTLTSVVINAGYTGTITLARDLTLSGAFTEGGGTGTFNAASYPFTVGGVFTLSGGTFIASSGTTNINDAMTITNSPTFNNNGGTVNFGGTLAVGRAISCNNVITFNVVTFSHVTGATKGFTNCSIPLPLNPVLSNVGSITLSAGSLLNGSGLFTLTGGTLNLNGGTFSSNFTGIAATNFTVGIGTYNLSSLASFVVGAMTTQSGSVTLPTAGATITGGMTIRTGSTVIASSGTTSVGAVFNLNSGGTFSSNNGILAVAGGFTNGGGTFNVGTGTVSLTGTNQTISGSTTFNNLTKTTAGTLTFAAGSTQTIQGALVLNGGDSSNLLSLVSDTTGNPWILNPQATTDLHLLNISDFTNTGPLFSVYESINAGGNTNVTFAVPSVPGVPSSSPNPTTNGTPGFTWTASTEGIFPANHYELQWSQDPTFVAGIFNDTASAAACAISTVACGGTVFLSTGTWYVQARAFDAVGNVSPYSSAGSVVIQSSTPSGGGGGSGPAACMINGSADINRDGIVDILDFNLLMFDWSKSGTCLRSDITSDGTVDIFDFNILIMWWERTV